MNIPDSCRAAVFVPDEKRLEIREVPLCPVGDDEILVRITMSAICGSDLHTIQGRRHPRGPLILGHEICGVIARLGSNVSRDYSGQSLSIGDRITWSITVSCGNCFFCRHEIPQKCENLFKYGHESMDVSPPLNGGFAEYIYLKKGTAVFRLSHDLPDPLAVFANCSLATVTAAIRMADVVKGESVLIQGAGLLGLCAAAICSASGADRIMVTDVSPSRLELAKEFGATDTFNVSQTDLETFIREVRRIAGNRGFDSAIEVCGHPEVFSEGIEALRIGGRYISVGCVFPNAFATIDINRIVAKMVTIMGLHNYMPLDLQKGLEFLGGAGKSFPFDKVIAQTFPLEDISLAVKTAINNRNFLRVAIT